MPTENKIDCPALHKRSNSYPFGDRVPSTVRMLKTVTADPMPGIGLACLKGNAPVAKAGQTYPVWTNSHGAVTAVMEDGTRLGLRPAEFEVDCWHDLATAPAAPHPEPIAWMVGTAIWWTKEETERDAANTGLPIVDLGPMTGAAEVDRLRVELGYMREERDDLSAKLDRFYSRSHGIKNLAAIEELSDKLAERDALLRDKSGDLIRMAAHLINAPLFALQDLQDEDKKMTRARVDHAVDVADARLKDAAYELRRIADALSASAGPSSPTWSCQACQAEQPTDRACDACGGQTALIAAES
jgi:hypothetical protein